MLPNLIGTDAQIAWASEIRERGIQLLEVGISIFDLLADSDDELMGTINSFYAAKCRSLAHDLITATSAATIIEMRDRLPSASGRYWEEIMHDPIRIVRHVEQSFPSSSFYRNAIITALSGGIEALNCADPETARKPVHRQILRANREVRDFLQKELSHDIPGNDRAPGF